MPERKDVELYRGPPYPIPTIGIVRATSDVYQTLGTLLESPTPGDDFVELRPVISPSARMRMIRTAFGVQPYALIDALGLGTAVALELAPRFRPVCPTCGSVARKFEPRSIESNLTMGQRSAGYVALVDQAAGGGAESRYALSERLELLGAEWAIIQGRLCRADDVGDQEGEAVISLATVRDLDGVKRSAEGWFNRGGSALRMCHLAGRDSIATEVGVISPNWSCPTCLREFLTVTPAALLAAPSCERCRGEGWLEQLALNGAPVWHACLDCDGIGFRSQFLSYSLGGVSLGRLRERTFAQLRDIIASEVESPVEASDAIDAAVRFGFGAYPICASVECFSSGENIALTRLLAYLDGFVGATLVVDLPANGLLPDAIGVGAVKTDTVLDTAELPIEGVTTTFNEFCMRGFSTVCIEHTRALESLRAARSVTEWISLREVTVGPLDIPALSIPIQAGTLITGDPGTGKSVLLRDVLYRSFGRRKKLTGRCDFGRCNSIEIIDCTSCSSSTLLDLLGLSNAIAELVSATESARVLGYSVEDCDPTKTRYRCTECAGIAPDCDGCSVCGGSGYDWHLMQVKLGASSLLELIATPISKARELLWSSDRIDAVLNALRAEISEEWSLGMSVRLIPPAVRRYLFTAARLAWIAACQGKGNARTHGRSSVLKTTYPIVLIDRPFGVGASHAAALLKQINQIIDVGATVIVADSVPGLESGFDCVVRLAAVVRGSSPKEDHGATSAEALLHRRLSRRCSVV